MTLFMTLLVRDEEDVTEANLRFHLESGVDHVIVTDNLSVDATPEIVQHFVEQGVATLIHESSDNYAQSHWVSRMANIAASRGAKWVIHCDADEFWIAPKELTLKQFFARTLFHNVVVADRHDFVCLEDDGRPFWQRMTYRKRQSLNPAGRSLPPKVAHRARQGLVVAQGNHSVKGLRRQRQLLGRAEILHFPLRSRTQYLRKIENGGRAYANNQELDEQVGSTWRDQYRELQTTGSLSFVDNNVVDERELLRMLSAGEVVVDERLQHALETMTRF